MASELDQLADRHLRPDPHGLLAPLDQAKTGRVVLKIAPALAASIAGQHLAWMLVNLLARQFRIVSSITLDVDPHTPLQARVAPFGEAPSLEQTLLNCIRLVAGEHVAALHAANADSAQAEIEIIVGTSRQEPRAPIQITTHADGWRLFVGRQEAVPQDAPVSALPFGPYLAACFTAGEVFKHLRGLRANKGHFLGRDRDINISAWSCGAAPAWHELTPDPPIGHIELPALYIPGAGAVGQAAALAFGALPDAAGHITTADDDCLDLTNGNRYVLAQRSDNGAPKVPLLTRFLNTRGFSTYGFEGKWEKYVTRVDRKPNRSDIDTLEHRFRYGLVLSCVDDNGARHAIRNLWPDLIIGGSTLGLTAKVTTYDMSASQLCLKCYNPVVERNQRVKEQLARLKNAPSSEREAFFRSIGVDPVRAAKHLEKAGCGQLSERDLDRFAAGEPTMSVGFVSAAAGVMLAAHVVRLGLQPRTELTARGAALIANFYRPTLRWLPMQPETGCDCLSKRESIWQIKWGCQRLISEGVDFP